MQFPLRTGRTIILLILVSIVLAGCGLLSGQGTDVFVPEEGETIDDSDSLGPPGNPTGDQGELESVPTADGFDFPVGNRNGGGWGITGYGFLVWSRYSNSWHPGEDWNIPGAGNGDHGKPVYSIANGIVVFSGFNTALGHVILVEHHLRDGNKVWSQYAHLAERWVKKGDIVGRRQQIGTVGRGPNNRFAAHLHFEIRKENLPANAWPRTAGQAWTKSKVQQFWLNPSQFIWANRP